MADMTVYKVEHTKNTRRHIIIKTFGSLILLFIGIMIIIPFIWMIFSSVKPEIEVFSYPVRLFPKKWMFSNYVKIWTENYSFALFYLNSIKVTVLILIGQLLTSTLAAYGFSKVEFRFRDTLFIVFLANLMVPNLVLWIPRFILLQSFNLLDTHLALILPLSFSAFATFLLRQFFLTIPRELSEAAFIDGCSHLKFLWRILLPLSKPAITSVIIISFVQRWNDYENPLIFLNTKELYTVPLGLTLFIDETIQQYALIMAGAVSALVPVIIIFLLGQQYFIEGITTSGIKG